MNSKRWLIDGISAPLKAFKLAPLETEFLDTPRGILTPGGLQFQTRVHDLDSWAARVYDHVPLRTLLAEVGQWLEFPKTIVIWLTPVFLVFANPWVMVALLLLLAPLLKVFTPPLINRAFVRLSRVLNLAWFQGLFYIVFLSIAAQFGPQLPVFLALAVFVTFRLGILDSLFNAISNKVSAKMYELKLPDVALRSLIVNTAALYGIELQGHEKFSTKGNLFSWRR